MEQRFLAQKKPLGIERLSLKVTNVLLKGEFVLYFNYFPGKEILQVKFNDFENFYFDHNKFRSKVNSILEENGLSYADIAKSLGYSEEHLTNYMEGSNNSRFVAGALCDRFRLSPKSFFKEF